MCSCHTYHNRYNITIIEIIGKNILAVIIIIITYLAISTYILCKVIQDLNVNKKKRLFFIRFNSVYTVRKKKKSNIYFCRIHRVDKRIMVFICRMSHVCVHIFFFSLTINRRDRLLLLRIRAFRRGFQTRDSYRIRCI